MASWVFVSMGMTGAVTDGKITKMPSVSRDCGEPAPNWPYFTSLTPKFILLNFSLRFGSSSKSNVIELPVIFSKYLLFLQMYGIIIPVISLRLMGRRLKWYLHNILYEKSNCRFSQYVNTPKKSKPHY
jgi:hypothetical protein